MKKLIKLPNLFNLDGDDDESTRKYTTYLEKDILENSVGIQEYEGDFWKEFEQSVRCNKKEIVIEKLQYFYSGVRPSFIANQFGCSASSITIIANKSRPLIEEMLDSQEA